MLITLKKNLVEFNLTVPSTEKLGPEGATVAFGATFSCSFPSINMKQLLYNLILDLVTCHFIMELFGSNRKFVS